MCDSGEELGADRGAERRIATSARYECETCGVAAPALGLCFVCRAGYARRVKATDVERSRLARRSEQGPARARTGGA